MFTSGVSVPDESPKHYEALARVVHDLFLPLGYSQEETEGFLQNQMASQADPAELCRLETESGVAFARITRSSAWEIPYLIPADWDRRYEILEKALTYIVSEARRAEAAEVSIRIEENPPSHNAYFAGVLPLMGFTLTPRAGLAAPLEALDRLSPSELPDGLEEVAAQESDLGEIVQWYSDALLSHRSRPISDEARRAGDRAMLEGFVRYLHGENSQVWVVLADGNRKVAVAIGSCADNGDLTLSQVGVASTHRGMGLGRHIITRCMQELLHRYGDRGKRFWVRTGRTWLPAYRLYQRLGFRTHDFYTYAQHFLDE